MKRLKYLETLKKNHKTALKIAFLNPDETIQKEITNEIYNISGVLNVNYQNGARRTCTITINNNNNAFPIGWNGFWIGQKFQLWTGLYIEGESEPYLISQGIFYILNPKEAFNPTTRTITLQGVDKWAYLDGRLFGYLNGTYVAAQANNSKAPIKDLVNGLLKNNKFENDLSETEDVLKMVDCKPAIFDFNDQNTYMMTKYTTNTGRLVYKCDKTTIQHYNDYNDIIDVEYCTQVETFNSSTNNTQITYYPVFKQNNGDTDNPINITFKDTEQYNFVKKNGNSYERVEPTNLSIYQVEIDRFIPPYTVNMEIGKTFADIMLEYNTMLMGKVFYDREGYLRFEPMSTSIDDVADTNREVAWHFTVTEQELLGLELEHKFDKVFNDVIVLGAITNGRQAKARVQNRNSTSETSIDRIGLKTKTPYQSDQYYTDDQCSTLAQYYAQLDMALEKAGTISSLPIYHLDVGQIVTISTPNNYMSQEPYLVTAFSYNFNGTMSVTVTNLRYFSKWTNIYRVTYRYLYRNTEAKPEHTEEYFEGTKLEFNQKTAPEIEGRKFDSVSPSSITVDHNNIIVTYKYLET